VEPTFEAAGGTGEDNFGHKLLLARQRSSPPAAMKRSAFP
jgi:hypothetical protein